MTVQQIMTQFPTTLDPGASIHKAAQLMRDDDIGVIPIVDGLGTLVGIVTDRDIVIRAVAEGLGPDASVEECMSPNIDTVAKDTPLEYVTRLMSQKQIRRLPVVENGRLIGIVSLGDLATSGAPEQEKAETLAEVSVDAGALRTSLPGDRI